MSLKAIKNAVEVLAENPPENRSMLLAARDEVAALEKAAVVLAVNGVLARIEERATKSEREAVAVLKAIAKEAK